MPMDFKDKFGTTRIILDATEVKMTKPGKLSEQSSTWSSYKNANTAKTMVGISPKGVVTYVSPAYGGSTSDRQIIERSELLEDGKFEAGDSIMADRGIMVNNEYIIDVVSLQFANPRRKYVQCVHLCMH